MTDLPAAVGHFLDQGGWRLAGAVELGTTSDVWIVQRGEERRALKRARPGADSRSLRIECEVLHYLTGTAASQYVPWVGDWLPEIGGYLIEYLHYSTDTEKAALDLPRTLGAALRAVHGLEPPLIDGLPDDRPDIALAISRRFEEAARVVQAGDAVWSGLDAPDRERLELVRARLADHVRLLPGLARTLDPALAALTHGDLAGDNLMVAADGRLVLADWGAARISSPLADVAHLCVYANWSDEEAGQFLDVYFEGNREAREKALPPIRTLSHLIRYRSCVQSLAWLNVAGDDGLDAVGRAHLERQVYRLESLPHLEEESLWTSKSC